MHILVLEAFVGPRPAGMEGCHWDDDPTNNHLSNLRWDTRSANARDAVRNGRNQGKNKTHCPRGHELIGANIVAGAIKRGWRQCRACANAAAHANNIGAEFDPAYADAKYAAFMAGATA
jgi:hypothetical protein